MCPSCGELHRVIYCEDVGQVLMESPCILACARHMVDVLCSHELLPQYLVPGAALDPIKVMPICCHLQ